MNQAEIMTLLSSKVKPATIRRSILAGKLSNILRQADSSISDAEQFRENADWTEMLRIMEGTLDKKQDYQAEDSNDPLTSRMKIKRDKFNDR